MLTILAVIGVATAQSDTIQGMKIVRAAAIAALDSASVWASNVVGHPSAIYVDVESFRGAASRFGPTAGDWSGFATSVHARGEAKTFEAARQCRAVTGRTVCTLADGVVTIKADSARVDGLRTVVFLTLHWPSRGAWSGMEYRVVVQGGRVILVSRGRVG